MFKEDCEKLIVEALDILKRCAEVMLRSSTIVLHRPDIDVSDELAEYADDGVDLVDSLVDIRRRLREGEAVDVNECYAITEKSAVLYVRLLNIYRALLGDAGNGEAN